MGVALKGSSAVSLTAGILLLSRSRSFGQPLQVEILGDPLTITPVPGPALVHAPVLASCGIGRELGSGALVIVPGPAREPLAVSISEDGTGEWFWVDRAGDGAHPASRAFVELCRSPVPACRALGRSLCDALAALGCPAEPALIDLLCAAPAPPLIRLSLALRAGQAMRTGPRVSVTRFLAPQSGELPDPLDTGSSNGRVTPDVLAAARTDGRLLALVDRAHLRVRDRLVDWLTAMDETDPDGRYAPLVCGLVEVLGHLAGLPDNSMLPPLSPAADAVAVGLGAALGASGEDSDANLSLSRMYRFLGGRFSEEARYPVDLPFPAPPADGLERWQWFCRATRMAADTADALWRRIVDPAC